MLNQAEKLKSVFKVSLMIKDLSIKTKMSVALSGLFILLIVVIAMFILNGYEKEQKKILLDQQFTLISVLASEISQKLNVSHEALIRVAKNVPVAYFKDPVKLQNYIETNQALYALFHNILIYSDRGIVLCANPGLARYKGADLSGLDYVKKTLASKKPVISEPFVSPVSKQPLIVMTAPITSPDGKILGFIGGSQYFLKKNLLGNLLVAKLGQTGYFYVSTRNRKVLAHADKDLILKVIDPEGANSTYDAALKGFEGVREDQSPTSGPALFSMKSLDFSDWLLTGVLPTKEAFAPIRNAKNRLILIALCAAALTGAIVWWVMQFLLSPLTALNYHIRTYAENVDTSNEIGIKSNDEIGEIANSFNEMVRNIADSKKELETANRKLLASEEQLEKAHRLAHIGVWNWIAGTDTVSWSDELYRIAGLDPRLPPPTYKDHASIYTPESWVQLSDAVETALKTGAPYRLELEMIRPDGDTRWLYAFGDVIRDTHGKITGLHGTVHDITERKELLIKLQQAQKMESIGTLAGGIAHDFNNILSPIIGYTEMLIDDCQENSSFMDSLNEIHSASMRAKNLVKQILAFSREDKSGAILMSINDILKEVLKLIRSTIPTTIQIKQDIVNDCGLIEADPTQIHQIVMNLATNSFHAMEETGGELKFTLKETQLNESDAMDLDMAPGNYAFLTVSDTGSGIPDDIKEKIFDPFFTTKERGKGTGMGLSVVHGIVKSIGGSIQVKSKPGKGTEFHVYLPVAASCSKQQEPQVKDAVLGGFERILLVDDEAPIIKMERKVLERLGYQVRSHTSSLEALEAFRSDPDKFDIVITDMAMPKMPGDKFANELKKIRPDIPVLLCTGFSNIMSEETALSFGINGFLMKPIVMKELSKKVREVLDETKGAGQDQV